MGKLSRDKGKRGEREVVKLLMAQGYEARRGWQSRGPEEPDVISDFPFYPEVKIGDRLGIFSAIEQVADNNKTEKPYMVFFKKDRGDWHVALRWEEFIKLCQKLDFTKII